MNEPIVHDGQVYPDEEAFVAATHPNIPEEIKRIYVGPEPKEEEPKPDYDYDSWQKANPGVQMAPGQHYPDTYKLPNHITFSDESIYHSDVNQGGHWGQDEQGKDTFTPGPTNLQNYSFSQIKDYFQRVEPDVKLIVPDTAAGMASQATEKAAGALKSAQSIPATVDSDTGIDGPVTHQIPWLRQAMPNLDSNITEGDYNKAEDIGLSFSGGGLTFGGVKSVKPLNKLSDLGHAQVLEANAIHPDVIHQQTGFFRGSDGRWRHEIDDSKSVFDPNWADNPTAAEKKQGFKSKMLTEVLDHPELYKAYPSLKNVKVTYDVTHPPGSAQWDNSLQEITMGNGAVSNHGTLMHEVQHAVQDLEGFAQGGSPGTAGKEYQLRLAKDAREKIQEPLQKLYNQKLQNELEQKTVDIDIFTGKKDIKTPPLTAEQEKEMARLTELANKFNAYAKAGDAKAFENYLRLAGETESRNVDTRLLLTEAERRKIYPQWTADVDLQHQIVTTKPISTSPYTDKIPIGSSLRPRSVEQFRRAANDNTELTIRELRQLKSDLRFKEFKEFQKELDAKIEARKAKNPKEWVDDFKFDLPQYE